MEIEPVLPTKKDVEPTPATLIAWEVRSNMLLFLNSDPNSAQAEAAHDNANKGFEALVRMTEPEIARSIKRHIHGDVEDVFEIMQETYIRAYRGLPRFRGDGPVEAWLSKIARNKTKDHNAKRSKQLKRQSSGFAGGEGQDFLNTLAADGEDQDPYWWLENDVQRKALIMALEDLTPKYRMPIVLHHVFGATVGEIARREGVSETNAKQIIFRAVRMLRRNPRLKEQQDTTEE